MWVPLVVLAAGAVLVGMIFGPTGLFERHVIGKTASLEALGHAEHATDWLSIALGTIAGLAGLALSYVMYAAPSPIPRTLADRLGPLYRASYEKFKIDEIYEATVIRATWLVAAIARVVDVYVVDGLVRLVAWVPRFVGREILAPFQNGLIQFYAAVTALGVAGLLVILLLLS